MKRKEPDGSEVSESNPTKRRYASSTRDTDLRQCFRDDLFEDRTVRSYQNLYETSGPYPHAVVPSLIESSLLKEVRDEITTHISFTIKETDIYRIHQSGDLANLSNLDSESLQHLPSLVQLRDALYSSGFREWVSTVTGAGKLSGSKTDMAVNVYTPGSYLLCHDDVIGSRRISYILYLTDPDPEKAWRPDWGGGLRLYPTEDKMNQMGETIKVPVAEHSLNIPPSFGQLSFFAVRPGESYHDVEEVYHSSAGSDEPEGLRTRMAISGWYHIPQEGEDGYETGAEEAQALKSSLAQLEGAADEFDEPRIEFRGFTEHREAAIDGGKGKAVDAGDPSDQDDDILTEQDLNFLLGYIAPSFLTPDMTEKLATSFEEHSILQLDGFLCAKFEQPLKPYVMSKEAENSSTQGSDRNGSTDGGHQSETWHVARPPHKHRYVWLANSESQRSSTVLESLSADLLCSQAFRKWLGLITGFSPRSLIGQHSLVRRFRKGQDYALANSYKGDNPQLEFTIGITPSDGWEVDEDQREAENGNRRQASSGHLTGDWRMHVSKHIECGGEEVYMAGDDDDDEDAASTQSKSLPRVGKKSDPAIYKSAENDNDDNGILFTNAPSWNTMSIVLRDKGTLRFVKYVSQAARGDRWDIKGQVRLSDDAFDDGGDDAINGEGLGQDDEVAGEGDYDDGEEDEDEDVSDDISGYSDDDDDE